MGGNFTDVKRRKRESRSFTAELQKKCKKREDGVQEVKEVSADCRDDPPTAAPKGNNKTNKEDLQRKRVDA